MSPAIDANDDCATAASSYRPPPWLTNGHAQTIYASLLAPCPRVALQRVRWTTPDGDFIDLDWQIDTGTRSAAPPASSPLIVLFHGLEGSSRSHYARTLLDAVKRRGWRAVVVHFRGCSGEPNRLPRAYHSGDTAEIDWILQRLRDQHPGVPLCPVAVSLGANVLLKWLGERGSHARQVVAAACAVSAPLDLMQAGAALDRGFNRVYTWNFLRTLRRKSLAKLEQFPQLFEREATRIARSLRAFDDAVTAPLHGFIDARDYWTRCSSKPWLRHIALPSLVLNARDDPFLPESALPASTDVSAQVRLEFPAHGGHVGFVTGRFPGSLAWMPQRVLAFIEASLDHDGRHHAEPETQKITIVTS